MLGENVENLTNTGTFRFFGTGNELANIMTGGVGPNNFFGLGGKDLLIGGAVTDILEGGDQDDTLIGNGGATSSWAATTTINSLAAATMTS